MNGRTLYTDGTADFTNGSDAVVGHSTAWASLLNGEPLLAPDGKWYEITIVDDTNILLDRAYEGATALGASYTIFKTSTEHNSVRSISQQLSTISANYRRTISVTGDNNTITLNKAGEEDVAGNYLQRDENDIFQFGLMNDDEFSIQFLLGGATWTKAFSIDSSIGGVALLSQLLLGGVISPPQIIADTNDYDPTGLAQANVIRFETDQPRHLTGMKGGRKGRIIALLNVGSENLIIDHESNNSLAVNRFKIGDTAAIIRPGTMSLLFYDHVDLRWKLMFGEGLGLDAIYRITLLATGKPPDSEDLPIQVFTENITLQENLPGSRAIVADAPTDTAIFTLEKNGVAFGTLTFTAGETIGTFATTETLFVPGDVLGLVAPSPRDSTLATLSLTIKGVGAL